MTLLGSLTKNSDFADINEVQQLSSSVYSSYEAYDLSSTSLGNNTFDNARLDYLVLDLNKWFSQVNTLSDNNTSYAELTAITLVSRYDVNYGPWNISLVATKNMTSPVASNNIIAETQLETLPNTDNIPVKYIFDKPVVLNNVNAVNNELSIVFKNNTGSRQLNVGVKQVKCVNASNAPIKPLVSNQYISTIVCHVKTSKNGKDIKTIQKRLDNIDALIGNLPAVIDAI